MTTTLDVLTCHQCSAPIPFGDDATSTCPFCRTANKVPAAYRELRASQRADAAARAEAERLLRTLDRPPWLATKVLARMFDLPMLAFWLLYAIPLGLWVITAGMAFSRWLAPRIGVRTGDDVPYWITISFMFGLLFVCVFVPRVLGIYANRRTTSRVRLLAGLAAKPPRTKGGPALCRRCGAPLFVATGELVSTCSYCSTENAVQLRTEVVAAVRRSATRLAKTVAEAAASDRAEKQRTRRLLLHELFRYVWPTVIFAAAFMTIDIPVYGPVLVSVSGLLLIGLVIRSLARAPSDSAERRAGNDMPGWVAALGPLIVWFLFVKLPLGC
jgi:uncharacterized Zn finger protein (UPF0148 family)